ncbi:hypothetical protein MBCUT_12070 [Methanobrevibacter cuticularis]|uniref:Acid-resistance membrane protein n=1 Tax=Methanobrevibacter cuticularis TaxID=47311 RepID=A0A166DRP9_9EURY|nr:hypothetical protein [Methanobrevibacter cuticularis]KZX15882.1 hypothetical protein MBCUT_12070 [Methanobrevibacter cuticularis]
MNFNRTEQFAVIFAFIFVSWSLLPLVENVPITTMTIASSVVLFLVGIAYPIIIFKPEWSKAILLFEGIIFLIIGLMYLNFPVNIIYMVLGLILVVVSLMAYANRLPGRLFSRTRKF